MELISGNLQYYSVKKCVQTDCSLLFNCNWYLRYSIPVSERKNLASFYGHDVESAETSLADKMVSITYPQLRSTSPYRMFSLILAVATGYLRSYAALFIIFLKSKS